MSSGRGVTWIAMVLVLFQTAPAAGGEFVAGVGTHLGQGKGTVARNFSLVDELGANSIRDDVYWRDVEVVKGDFRFADAKPNIERLAKELHKTGNDTLLMLGYGNPLYHSGEFPLTDKARAAYARYCQAAALHYSDSVQYFEIWNEWNQRGSATDYAALLAASYSAIKHVNPSATVVGGAVEGATLSWTRQLLAAGGGKSMDAFSVHPYMFWKSGDGTPERLFAWMLNLKAMLDEFPETKNMPVFVTEIGWPVNTTQYGVPENVAASYLARTYVLMRSLPFVKGVWWYELRNSGTDPKNREHNFGLVTQTDQPKPAFVAMRDVLPPLLDATSVDFVEQGPKRWIVKGQRAGGASWVFAWASDGTANQAVRLTATRPGPVTVAARRVGTSERVDYGFSKLGEQFEMPLSGTPWLFEGTVDGTSIVGFEGVPKPRKPTGGALSR